MRRRIVLLVTVVGILGALGLVQTIEPERLQRGWTRLKVAAGNFFDWLVVEAEAGLLIDADTGEILYRKNAERRMYPASTTKILTALVAIERGDLDEVVTVGEEVWMATPGESRAGLRPGERWTLRDLIKAMLLPSGNDAARTIAVHIARKEFGEALDTEEALARFAELMNERAAAAGATDSHFVNPHGLHDEAHYSTALDLARIAVAAMQLPEFREIVRIDLEDVVPVAAEDEKSVLLFNRNRLVNPGSDYYFPAATGIKTGYTSAAGWCLVSSAEADGRRIIAVVLNSSQTGVWTDSIRLLEYGLRAEGRTE